MWGFLADIKQFFAQVMSLGNWLILGAALAFLGALFRKWVGYAGVAVGGAVIMFFALTGNWLADDSKKVEQLERELQWEQAKRAEIEATNKALHVTLQEEADANEANEATFANLKAQIDALQDQPECGVGEEFTDELKKLR